MLKLKLVRSDFKEKLLSAFKVFCIPPLTRLLTLKFHIGNGCIHFEIQESCTVFKVHGPSEAVKTAEYIESCINSQFIEVFI